MLEIILVPLDGSPLAEIALPYAQQMVADNGQITLLMVIEDREPTILGRAIDYLDRIATKINRANLRVETTVNLGNAADEIVDLGKSMDAIVMSTRGHTGISRWALGSVTQKVVTAAPCPVFVIPSNH